MKQIYVRKTLNLKIRRLREFWNKFKVTSVLASYCRLITKDNQKDMNHETWNHREEAPMKDKLKEQKNALVITRRYLKQVKHSLY